MKMVKMPHLFDNFEEFVGSQADYECSHWRNVRIWGFFTGLEFLVVLYILLGAIITNKILNSLAYQSTMKTQAEHVYDSYGFRTKPSVLAVETHLYDPDKHQEQMAIWENLLKKDFHSEQNKQIIRGQVRKGIPDAIRPKVWMQLITPPLKDYDSLVVKQELKEIDRDINRTIPTNKREGELMERLKNMLNIIAVAFPEMGYCQGLNFITGNLLVLLNDRQTFSVMYHILYWQSHVKVMIDLKRMHSKMYSLKKLIRKHFPKLSKFLDKMGVQPMIYAFPWFVTLFHNSLPCQYVFRITEIYFLEGEKILYRVALQILKEKKRFIKTMTTPEDITNQIRNKDEFDITKIEQFFRDMFEIQLSRKQIEGYEKQYEDLPKQQ